MPIISIIVPVYKVEQYLKRCLDSVLSQTFTDFECILVDDCSPDNCPVICDEYVKKDSRFTVIHKQQNEGLPMARKSGLSVAVGDFIMHVDSDDWLELNALEKLYNKQLETNADVVIGSFRQIFKNKIYDVVFNNYIITYKQKALSDFFSKRFKNVWGKLYRASLFEHIIQPSNLINGEDGVINTQIFCSANCNVITITNDIVYNYDHTTGGISQGSVWSTNIAINYFECYVFIRKYLKQNGYFNFGIKKCFYVYVFSTVYMKMFYNVPKCIVLKLFKEANFPYIFFSFNMKLLFFNAMNILFLINQNVYKIVFMNILSFRKKLKK
jgi:glycosyltransferase involved in cell wall biosynthesis